MKGEIQVCSSRRRVGFFRSGLKADRNRPELREVLIRVVRKGSMLPPQGGWDWVKEAGGGLVGCHNPVDFFRGERGKAGKAIPESPSHIKACVG